MTKRRSRGRPPGTGKNDTPYLACVADMRVSNPALKPTTAMKQIIAEHDDWLETPETLLRRWQGKWRLSGEQFMQGARVKAIPKRAPASGGDGYISPSAFDHLIREQQRMKDMIDPPHMRALREQTMAAAAAARNLAKLESPVTKMLREQQHTRDIIDPPAARAMRELMDNPAARATRELMDNPIQREMRRMEEMQRLMRGF